MRSFSFRFVILAASAATLAAGCETHDRMLYNCRRRPPLRIHEPSFKPPPEYGPVEEPGVYFK